MRMYSMAHCVCIACTISNYIYIYPVPEHVCGTVQISLESVHDLEVGERHLASLSLYKLKASVSELPPLTELYT